MLRSENLHLSVSDLAFEIDGDGALKIEERRGCAIWFRWFALVSLFW